MLRFSVLLLALGLVPTRAYARVAILGIEGLGLEESVVYSYERLLETTVREMVGGQIITRAEIEAALHDPTLAPLRDCRGDTTCLLALADALDANLILDGTLTQLGDNHILALRCVDASDGSETRAKETLSGSEDQLVTTLEKLVTQLIDPERYRGYLLVTSQPPDAALEIDGRVVPRDGQPIPLSTGQHTISLSKPGFRTHAGMAEIRFGETAKVDVTMEPSGIELLPVGSHWWPKVAIGAGGASLASSLVLGLLARRSQSEYEDHYAAGDRLLPFFEKRADDGRTYALWTNVTLIAGSALVTAGLAGWVFGIGAEEDTP